VHFSSRFPIIPEFLLHYSADHLPTPPTPPIYTLSGRLLPCSFLSSILYFFTPTSSLSLCLFPPKSPDIFPSFWDSRLLFCTGLRPPNLPTHTLFYPSNFVIPFARRYASYVRLVPFLVTSPITFPDNLFGSYSNFSLYPYLQLFESESRLIIPFP